MATGDMNDVLSRLNATLPPWFGNAATPVLNEVLSAYAAQGSELYSQLNYVQLQTRITTATDTNLDNIAIDFFGVNGLSRGAGESDASYRNRIIAYLLREEATLNGMYKILILLTGNKPLICIPGQPLTCGGYSIGGCGYGVAGGYSADNPSYTAYQCFIKVFTSNLTYNIVSGSSGYNNVQSAWNGAGSNFAWGAVIDIILSPQNQDIYNAINSTKPEGTVCWVAIVST